MKKIRSFFIFVFIPFVFQVVEVLIFGICRASLVIIRGAGLNGPFSEHSLKPFGHVCLLGLLIGCASLPQSPSPDLSSGDALYRLAENMKRNGDYGTAIRFYRQVLSVDPDARKAQLGLAETLLLDGKIDESRAMLDRMLLKNPDDGELLRAFGKVTIAQNDLDACFKTYTTLQKSCPNDAAVLNGLGICHDLSRQHDLAQPIYQRAIALAPDNLNIQSNYGLSLALSGKTAEAILLLSKLAYRSETTSNIRHNLAVAYGLAGDVNKARGIFSQDLGTEDLKQNIAVLKSLHPVDTGSKSNQRNKKSGKRKRRSLVNQLSSLNLSRINS